MPPIISRLLGYAAKPTVRVAAALLVCTALLAVAWTVVQERMKEDMLSKHLDAASFQQASPYRELLDQLFLDIDKKFLAFTNARSVAELRHQTTDAEIIYQLREAQREIYASPYHICCLQSVEIYYNQIGVLKSVATGLESVRHLSDDEWRGYTDMLLGKRQWLVTRQPSGAAEVAFVRPIPPVGNKPQGMVKAVFDLSLFQLGYSQPGGRQLWAVAGGGEFMFETALGEEVRRHELFAALMDERSGSMTVKEEGRLYGYKRFASASPDWQYVLQLPAELVPMEGGNPSFIVLAALAVAIVAAAYVLLVSRQMEKPLARLSALYKEFAGDGRQSGGSELAGLAERVESLLSLIPDVRHGRLRRLLADAPYALGSTYASGTPDAPDAPPPDDAEAEQLMLKATGLDAAELFGAAVVRIDDYGAFLRQYSLSDRSLYRFFVRNVLEETHAGAPGMALYDTGERDFVLLYAFGGGHSAAAAGELIRGCCADGIEALRRYLPFHVQVGIGAVVPRAAQIGLSYGQALQVLDHERLLRAAAVYEYAPERADGGGAAGGGIAALNAEAYRIRKECERAAAAALHARDTAKLEEALQPLIGLFERMGDPPQTLVKHTLWEIVLHLHHSLREAGVEARGELQLHELSPQLMQQTGLQACRDWLLQLGGEMMRLLERTAATDSRSVIPQIMDYIHQNFDKEISLSGIAGQLRMDASYLSRSFKQEIGVAFMEYLLSLRIERAKYLLSKDAMTIQDVAQAVGYINVNSFIRIFKKHVGMTPGSYRELHAPKRLDPTKIY